MERSERLLNFLSFKQYLKTLRRFQEKGEVVDLRSMLSETGDPTRSGFGPFLFPEFMLGEGYDGVIYIEGGDISEQNNPTSYVFYNLEKVGTYESWQKT